MFVGRVASVEGIVSFARGGVDIVIKPMIGELTRELSG